MENEDIFVAGGTVIRLRIETPADNSLDNQRMQLMIQKIFEQPDEFARISRLYHHGTKHQLTIIFCLLRTERVKSITGIYRVKNHRKDLVLDGFLK